MLPEALAKVIFTICLGLHGPGDTDVKHDCFETLTNCAIQRDGSISRERLIKTCLPKVLERK